MDNAETLLIILGLISLFALTIAAVGALKEYFSEFPEDKPLREAHWLGGIQPDRPWHSPKNTSYTEKPMENILQELTDEQIETLAGQRDLIIQDVSRTAGTWADHELHSQTNESAIMLLDLAFEISRKSEYINDHGLMMLRDKIYNLLDFAKHELHIDRLRSESLATIRAAQQEQKRRSELT